MIAGRPAKRGYTFVLQKHKYIIIVAKLDIVVYAHN